MCTVPKESKAQRPLKAEKAVIGCKRQEQRSLIVKLITNTLAGVRSLLNLEINWKARS